MNQQYRLYRRSNGTYYLENCETRQQRSLKTKNKVDATRLLNAENEALKTPLIARQLGKAYYRAVDPEITKRTWRYVFQEIVKTKQGPTAVRWSRVDKDKAFKQLWDRPLTETRAEHFLKVLEEGTVSTNVYLRRLHNFAFDMEWLPAVVLPKKRWPKVKHGEKRAITGEEHRRIIEREQNPERRAFYEVCWELGGSQSDVACLNAENIDWTTRTITYKRKKVAGSFPQATIGPGLEKVLLTLPSTGPLFPCLRNVRESDRATASTRKRISAKGKPG